ncbi:hypothetical protein [Gluconacetobacter sp.]|uniref:hypothetical protein n=1 Tax=Gluconacetobacter sp. TaxID=1935994 RepID=UPI0039EC8BBB
MKRRVHTMSSAELVVAAELMNGNCGAIVSIVEISGCGNVWNGDLIMLHDITDRDADGVALVNVLEVVRTVGPETVQGLLPGYGMLTLKRVA